MATAVAAEADPQQLLTDMIGFEWELPLTT
jgi:hypothetical protein